MLSSYEYIVSMCFDDPLSHLRRLRARVCISCRQSTSQQTSARQSIWPARLHPDAHVTHTGAGPDNSHIFTVNLLELNTAWSECSADPHPSSGSALSSQSGEGGRRDLLSGRYDPTRCGTHTGGRPFPTGESLAQYVLAIWIIQGASRTEIARRRPG